MRQLIKKALTVFALAAITVVMAPPAEAEAYESYGTCYAYTTCANGQTIWCRVSGSSSNNVACSWYVRPGRSVECHGLVSNGYSMMWQNYYYTCGY